jgi:GH24 family phage-related lysozyme (muramidase)
MSYLDDSVAHLEVFEGVVPWMYLDIRGYVTVGVGEMLATSERAVSLGFLDTNNQPIAPSAILDDYTRVSALPPAKTAGFYRSSNSPILLHSAIDTLLMQHLVFFDTQLSQRFANYSGFPDTAKLGLLDMIYNLGASGLFNGFPTFMGYVQKQDWPNAATQCQRNGPGPARNEWTKQQFLAAADAANSRTT